LDDLVQAHFDDVHSLAFALGHGDDAIAGLEHFAFGGRAVRDHAHDFREAVIPLQRGADAAEVREMCLMSNSCASVGPCNRVRIIAMGQRVEIGLKNFFGIKFLHGLAQAS